MRSQIDEYLQIQESNPLAVYEGMPPGLGGMSPGQRVFHEDPERKRALRCANKVGKTYAVSAEIWWWLTGTHPFRDDNIPRVNTGIYFVPDLEDSYADDVCKCLRELEPPGILAEACRYDPTKGYLIGQKRGILTKDGCRVMFRSSFQRITSAAGIKGDWMIWNEPPKRTHWGEMQRALSMSMGPSIGALTPVGDPAKPLQDLSWLRTTIEGNPATGKPPRDYHSQTVIELTAENCPHRTPQDIEEQKKGIPEWEWEQRARGGWESTSQNRRLSAWTPDLILPDDTRPGDGWDPSLPILVVMAVDHGEKAGASAWALYLFQVQRMKDYGVVIKIRVEAEYVSETTTTDEEDAMEVKTMIESVGLKLDDIDWSVGDVNSAGKSRAGRSLNVIYEGHFARLMRLHPSAPAFPMQRARKGAGSIDLGLKRLNQAMARGDWRVHPRCVRTQRAYKMWEGREDSHEHIIDRDRYAIMQIEHNLDFAQ